MILGIGTDIAEVCRFKSMNERMLERILSPQDLEYISKYKEPATHIAGFWAAKEALVKALNRKDLDFSQISILHEESGKPFFSFVPEKGVLNLSISHENSFAVAFVVWSL